MKMWRIVFTEKYIDYDSIKSGYFRHDIHFYAKVIYFEGNYPEPSYVK